jgi:hypothetical protein
MIQSATGQIIASEWVLKSSSEELKLLHNDNNSTASPALVSMAQSDRYALKMEPDAKVSFHAHPCLTRLSKRGAVQRDGNHPENYTNASSGNPGGKKDSKSIQHVQPSGRKKRMGSKGR